MSTTTNPNGDPTVNVALTRMQLKTAHEALLRELRDDLKQAAETLSDLADGGDLTAWPTTADARGQLRMVTESLDALDALGWERIAAHEESSKPDLMATVAGDESAKPVEDDETREKRRTIREAITPDPTVRPSRPGEPRSDGAA